VLEHVRPQVAVGRVLERAEERDDAEGEPKTEERGAVPAGEVCAAAPAQADGSLAEEQCCEPG
jgi:hypothetical protein